MLSNIFYSKDKKSALLFCRQSTIKTKSRVLLFQFYKQNRAEVRNSAPENNIFNWTGFDFTSKIEDRRFYDTSNFSFFYLWKKDNRENSAHVASK